MFEKQNERNEWQKCMRLNIGAATVRGHETILCAAPPQCSTYYILSPKPCCPKALFSLIMLYSSLLVLLLLVLRLLLSMSS